MKARTSADSTSSLYRGLSASTAAATRAGVAAALLLLLLAVVLLEGDFSKWSTSRAAALVGVAARSTDGLELRLLTMW